MGAFRTLFNTLILHLGDSEDEYRREHLSLDKAQSILTAIVVALAMIIMAIVDYALFEKNANLFRWMIWFRGAYGVFTVAVVLILRRTRDVATFDRIVFIWSLITAVFLVILNLTRSPDHLTTPFDILFPFAVYLLSPLKFEDNLVLTVGFSLGMIAVDSFYKVPTSPAALPTAIYWQVLVHLLGLPSSLLLQSYRRKTFKAYLDQKDAHEMANYLINIDGLTKCMTRLYFMEMAEKEFLRTRRYQLPLSLLMLDLDHFKRVNDTYGHQIGDLVLQRFAAVALEQKRAQDIFGRLGGEEFALLLPNTSLKNARFVAERIQQMWEFAPLTVDSKAVHSTVSIGVVEVEPSDNSFDDLLHRADEAMYKAKRQGRNRVEAG